VLTADSLTSAVYVTHLYKPTLQWDTKRLPNREKASRSIHWKKKKTSPIEKYPHSTAGPQTELGSDVRE
jgi:hypothetical protein